MPARFGMAAIAHALSRATRPTAQNMPIGCGPAPAAGGSAIAPTATSDNDRVEDCYRPRTL